MTTQREAWHIIFPQYATVVKTLLIFINLLHKKNFNLKLAYDEVVVLYSGSHSRSLGKLYDRSYILVVNIKCVLVVSWAKDEFVLRSVVSSLPQLVKVICFVF